MWLNEAQRPEGDLSHKTRRIRGVISSVCLKDRLLLLLEFWLRDHKIVSRSKIIMTNKIVFN